MSGSSTSAVLYAATVSAAANAGAAPENAKELRHHLKDRKGFVNPWDSFQLGSIWKFLPALLWWSLTQDKPDTKPPTVNVRRPDFLRDRTTDKLRATWLGHACYFVEFPSGLRVLFDPVFSDRCSPFTFMGPKRYTEVPCQVEDIPTLDAVIISHNHYDHLDTATLNRIRKRHPQAHYFVPLGNKQLFLDIHFPAAQITELDWWEQRDFTIPLAAPAEKPTTTTVTTPLRSESTRAPSSITATISCLPSQHQANRGLFDRNRTLWASWSVASPAPSASSTASPSASHSVFFGGDTGYCSSPATPHSPADPTCPAFAEIGAHRGPFDLGLIPIGAYEPRALFAPVHADPYDAVAIFRDTRCRRAMGIHWGTWVLTQEAVREPPRLLRDALRREGLAEEGVFDVCEIGESREF